MLHFNHTRKETRIAELESEIARMKEVERWISVSERLPESGQTVLAHGKGFMLVVCIYERNQFYRYFDSVPEDRAAVIYYDNIKMWKPFPSPPKP